MTRSQLRRYEDRKGARAFQEDRASMRGLAVAVVVFLGVLAACFVGVWWLYRWQAPDAPGTRPVPPAVFEEQVEHWESPPQDLARLRAREERSLGTYAWVDREAGVVRIPIDRAMRLIAEHGPERYGLGLGEEAE